MSRLILGDKLINWEKMTKDYIKDPRNRVELKLYDSDEATTAKASKNRPYVTPRLLNGELSEEYEDNFLDYFDQPNSTPGWYDKFQKLLDNWMTMRFKEKMVSNNIYTMHTAGNTESENSFHFFHGVFWNAKPDQTYEMVTIDAAEALGLGSELGSIETGKVADIILIDMFKPHLLPMNMPVTRLAHYANAADVNTVIVNG
ncbi:MAG: amidohydrolase family protein, partial [Pseudomonadales bacterium]|nr:amidohydrolase family protein [Pseudomonadales bacterium]